MIDSHGRNIEYLRLSVTQKCNLNCLYCSPDKAGNCSLLSPEQIEKAVRIMAGLGIKKVRITGGEPLMRADLEQIIKRVAAIDGIKDIPMTTNAIGLYERIDSLKSAGITRFNISLDSMNREKYKSITGSDKFNSVMKSIYKAIENNISLKINAVLIKGKNDDEIDDFINFAKSYPVEVRFIELMPIGKFGEDNRDKVVTGDEILKSREYLKYIKDGASGVARLYSAKDFKGCVGFISPISHKFCSSCNRIRMTADGVIKPCLSDNGETDIMPFIDNEEELEKAIYNAIFNKPKGHCFDLGFRSIRDMKRIGG